MLELLWTRHASSSAQSQTVVSDASVSLDALYGALAEETDTVGLTPGARPFRAHCRTQRRDWTASH